MMMAKRIAVTGCGVSPVTSVARLEKPAPIRPPSPVGSGQLSGAAIKAKTPQLNRLAATQVMTRSPIFEGVRRRMRLQPQSAGGTSTASMPRPKTCTEISASAAPGKPSQFCAGVPEA